MKPIIVATITLLFFCWVACASSEPRLGEYVISAPATFVVEPLEGPGIAPGFYLDTYLVIPIDSRPYKLLWTRMRNGWIVKNSPVELTAGQNYEFKIRWSETERGVFLIESMVVEDTELIQPIKKAEPADASSHSPRVDDPEPSLNK